LRAALDYLDVVDAGELGVELVPGHIPREAAAVFHAPRQVAYPRPHSNPVERRGVRMDLLYLAAPGSKGNEAFLGIGVIGWVIIVVLLVALGFFFYRARGRRAL
jgi:hypothetical protein